ADANTKFAQGFPFNLISRIRLIRNGSDVVWSGSGMQLAKESLYLNGRYPFARLWFDAATGANTGTAFALLTQTINGVVIPANSEGIGSNSAIFQDTVKPSVSSIVNFRCMMELWLQLGVSDNYFTTLLDARPLASYVLEITWANMADIVKVGAAQAASGVLTPTVNCSIQSYDQDNLQLGIQFGTFKRASFQPPGMAYSSSQVQALLPRGNLYFGLLMETKGFKAASLATIAEPGNDIVLEIQNRINSNYQLRDVFFRDLQAKNRNDGLVPANPVDPYSGAPTGWAMLYFPCTGDSIKELVASYTMDQFDLLLQIAALSGGADGNTYNGNPVINILTQEVIPGRSVGGSSARGAFAGSTSATSAKPGV
ncbi:MAG: hypothetical protein C5B47_00230, partial [Verrucomicrobia bacterium]